VEIRTGREKLLAERANIIGPCAQRELERNQLKMEVLNDHEQLLRDYGRSNAYGGDSVRTVTILDFQDPLIGLKEDLAKLKI
jgi:aminoglycoside/choline kinase family phosphotransferase